jgi:hypothetical protein
MKKKIYPLLFLVLMITTSAIVIEEPILGTPYGVRDATGNPANIGEGNCSGCHTGNAINTGGSLTISVKDKNGKAVTSYAFNELYTVDITVARSGISTYGFDAEVVTANNTDAGVITSTDTNKVQTLMGDRSTNMTHVSPGKTANSHTFSFAWKTPAADSGEITIYAAGLAANGNGKNTGDYTYTSVKKLKANPLAIAENESAIREISIYPNPVTASFHLSFNLRQANIVSVDLFALNGQKLGRLLMKEHASGQQQELLVLPAGIPTGAYLLQINADDTSRMERLLVR